MSESTSGISVPLAVIIAGGLIAGAVFLTGNAGDPAPDAPAVAEEEEEEREIVLRDVTEDDHIRGAEDARITIVEYSDLECVFCKRFHETMKIVIEEYPDDVRWVYRHAPIEQLHSQAFAEANAVECAGEEGRAWELMDVIFEVTPSGDGLDLDELPTYAAEAGVEDIENFEVCVEEDRYRGRVEADLEDAQRAGLRGTPYSVVLTEDGEKMPLDGALPIEMLREMIDSLLEA